MNDTVLMDLEKSVVSDEVPIPACENVKFRLAKAVLKCVFHVQLYEMPLVSLKKENGRMTDTVAL